MLTLSWLIGWFLAMTLLVLAVLGIVLWRRSPRRGGPGTDRGKEGARQ